MPCRAFAWRRKETRKHDNCYFRPIAFITSSSGGSIGRKHEISGCHTTNGENITYFRCRVIFLYLPCSVCVFALAGRMFDNMKKRQTLTLSCFRFNICNFALPHKQENNKRSLCLFSAFTIED